MARHLVETLTGVGTVHAQGELLRTTRYELSLWSDNQPGGGSEAVTDISGHIDITGIAEAVVLAGPDTVTLTIEDGRCLAFQLTNTWGGIKARGWLP
jgi:hypothetical protein